MSDPAYPDGRVAGLPAPDNHFMLSIVTPAFNEQANLPLLYERLVSALDTLCIVWEWIVIDDHSTDETYTVIGALAHRDHRVLGVRFARNSGSHAAVTYGLQRASGSCAVVMAADLQDPPESLPALINDWQRGIQVVWAVRDAREGESASTKLFARAYYVIMRRIVGMKDLPSTGADFFLVDRVVIDALGGFAETNTSVFALITWMGFRQSRISYVKRARQFGQSGWNFAKKLKLVVDSVVSFSFGPIRFLSAIGACVAVVGFAYAIVVSINSISGEPPSGWSSLMIVVLVIGGIQMLMMGVLGEYLWRTLDEARRRPRYLIEATTSSRHESRGTRSEAEAYNNQ